MERISFRINILERSSIFRSLIRRHFQRPSTFLTSWGYNADGMSDSRWVLKHGVSYELKSQRNGWRNIHKPLKCHRKSATCELRVSRTTVIINVFPGRTGFPSLCFRPCWGILEPTNTRLSSMKSLANL